MIRSNISFIVSKLIKNDTYELTKNMWRKNSVIFRKKVSKKIFQMCLSLSFHNYKIVFNVQISSALQTW